MIKIDKKVKKSTLASKTLFTLKTHFYALN